MFQRLDLIGWTKPFVLFAALFPALQLIWALIAALWFGAPLTLGANPAQTIEHITGDWCLQFLLLTLAVTPIRKLTGWNKLIRYRRMLGLLAFFYGVLHLSAYTAFDHVFRFEAILADIIKRPFVTVGMGALLLMLPLAITSTKGWIRRLGGQRWIQLHKLTYAIAVLGVVHYWWLVKQDVTWPIFYGFILALLLLTRVVKSSKAGKREKRAVRPITNAVTERPSKIPTRGHS